MAERFRSGRCGAGDSRPGEPQGSPRGPVRTCVGCRRRAAKSDLLRVVVVRNTGRSDCVPDPDGRLPGRGAWLHVDHGCLGLAERRRALPRALRVSGPLDTGKVRRHVEQQAGSVR